MPFRPLLIAALALAVAGCSAGGPVAGPPASPTAPTSTTAPASPSGAPSPTPSRALPAPEAPPGYTVTYGWAVPSTEARVAHQVRVPVAPPPAPPLPYLEAVEVSDHPRAEPPYSRVTFSFRGAQPGYALQYVREVRSEGADRPVPLSGNAFLRIRFVDAQAHDESGRSTVRRAPGARLGLPTLRGFGFGGDFEGHLTYGLGLQVAPGSDQVLPVRAGEWVRGDGPGRVFVVAFDVRRG